MKILVLYYSRTGTTRKVGLEIAKLLGCDTEEIIDTKNRKGWLGYISAGRDGTEKKLTIIQGIKHRLSDYDCLIIGTPVWAWNISSPIRTFLTLYKNQLPPRVAFFCTRGGSDPEKIFQELEKIYGKKAEAEMSLVEKIVKNGDCQDIIEQFIKEIKK